MAENPLYSQMRDWLPEADFGVMHHGFAPHGRDYTFIIEVMAATYELILTHVVELQYETRVRDETWPESWDDHFTDGAAWQAAGEPDGYLWATNWSLAYPGLDPADEDASATRWSERLGKPMHAMTVETDRFQLSIVFHDARARKLSDDAPTIRQVIFPL